MAIYRRCVLVVCGVVACAVVAGVLVMLFRGGDAPAQPPVDDPARRLAAARDDLRSGNWNRAAAIAEEVLVAIPDDAQALLVAGEAASRLGDFSAAVDYYSRIGEGQPEYLIATLAAADVERASGSLEQAERLYRKALDRDPTLLVALDRLALLMKLTGRHWEAREVFWKLLQRKAAHVDLLRWLAVPRRPLAATQLLHAALEHDPGQPFVRLGLADHRLAGGEPAAAEPLLRIARRQRPGHPEIEAAWGRCLWEQRRIKELERWWSTLPETVLEHPDVWFLAGGMYEELQQPELACRCYLECLRRDADYGAAAHRVGELLVRFGRPQQARPFLERSEELQQLASIVSSTVAAMPSADVCRRSSEQLESLSRPWEALAWAALAREQDPQAAWAVAAIRRLDPRLTSTAVAGRLPVDLGELVESFPAPERERTSVTGQSPAPRTPSAVVPEFVDEAASAGIDFTYFESPDTDTEGRRMFEFTGGGVAVLDFDCDGWPDVYFTQGARIPPASNERRLDELYRNVGGERFQRVTPASAIVEDGFSQGVAAGDVNNDGFPDLYVANLGCNRLFENMGDGTFLEVPAERLPPDDQWTTSCAIADVNLDGVPDLVDVNYLQGPGLLDIICPTPAGPRVCLPYAFEGAADRLCLGDGAGGFRDVSAAAGFGLPNGKGLGLVIGNLKEGNIDIFVANDTVANFLYENQAAPGEDPRYREIALLSGTAFSEEGQPQACMGVATGDFDGNGGQDLFVTNFFGESNALYLHQTNGLFQEKARSAGLRLPSLPLLGFGTQSIDVALTGRLDLVVANGDLDDFTHEGRPLKMRAQLFLNEGAGQFVEHRPKSRADYFSFDSAFRGRGLAKLDWNRDGLEDFAVSHLDAASALVTNRTEPLGDFIAIRFVGTVSSRDAIGLRVRVTTERDDHSRTSWLNAGDGYQASNERHILIGLPRGSGSLALDVFWPSGQRQSFANISRNGWSLCVESRANLLAIPRP